VRDCQGVGDGSAPTMMVTVEGGDGASKSQVYLGEGSCLARSVVLAFQPSSLVPPSILPVCKMSIFGKERRASYDLRLSINIRYLVQLCRYLEDNSGEVRGKSRSFLPVICMQLHHTRAPVWGPL
jgi:hypothetical protein